MKNIASPKVTVLTSLYKCKDYLNNFFQCLGIIEGLDTIEVLLLHNAPTAEETVIIQNNLDKFPCVKYHIIPALEGLYTTWNRGIHLANGEYICIWNVDDIRSSTSIIQQMKVLDAHPEAVLTYGDFGYMYQYANLSQHIESAKDFNISKPDFFCSHQIGCFPMWRKSVHNTIGYFDEQFKLVGDFDFQIRLARSYDLIRTNAMLGYYLEFYPTKLSANSMLQKKEQNVLCLRYGIWKSLNWIYLFNTLTKYRIRLPENSTFPHHRNFVIRKFPTIVFSIIKQPRNLLSYIKHDLLKLT